MTAALALVFFGGLAILTAWLWYLDSRIEIVSRKLAEIRRDIDEARRILDGANEQKTPAGAYEYQSCQTSGQGSDALERRLTDQGLIRGSEAFNSAMRRMGQPKTGNLSEALPIYEIKGFQEVKDPVSGKAYQIPNYERVQPVTDLERQSYA